MTAVLEDEVAPDSGATYIRGGAGLATTDRNVWRIVGWLTVVSIAATAIALLIGAVRHDQQLDRLRSAGKQVSARVASCQALASGTGVTADGFRCTVTYSYGARTYREILRNTEDSYPRGAAIDAIVDSSHPQTISLAYAVEHLGSRFKAYITPIMLAGISVIGALAMLGFNRRRPRDQP